MPESRSPRPFLLALLASLLVTAAAHAQAKRSVIIILMDSLRADHLQTYGYDRATSPNILAFSKKATVFEQAYPAAAWTRPSILALLTGRYSSELTTNLGGGSPLKDGHPTLASVLHSYKYTTAAFYNTAQLDPKAANLQGFDKYVDYGDKDYVAGHVDAGVDKTIEFLDSTSKPVFVFLHVLDPHHPYLPIRDYFGNVPAQKYRDSYPLATEMPPYRKDKIDQCALVKDWKIVPELAELYDSEIRDLDAQVGRLLKFLEEDKRYRDATVIVTSDHGEEFGEHGGLYHGARFYEESIRVPLIVRDPTMPHSIGRRVSSVVSLVDVAPTILQSLGIGYSEAEYSGKSFLSYLTRRLGPPRDTAIIERLGCGYDLMATVRKGDWKMIIRITRPQIELYNLKADPGEKHDLSESKAPRVRAAYKEVYGVFDQWFRKVNRPLSSRNGDVTPPLPPELQERMKALGYLQ